MIIGSAWQKPLPPSRDGDIVIREIEPGDARHLHPLVTSRAMRRLYAPPPKSVGEFSRFIDRARESHLNGDAFCLTLTVGASARPSGLFQVRRAEGVVHIAEWGFLMAPALWNSGVFARAAGLVLDLVFGVVELHRLEARVMIENRRAAAALLKLGARPEGVLRGAFHRDGEYVDSVMWAILRDDWTRRICTGPAGPEAGIVR
jgi:ribosomal-protein-alanine N-acetyltransferase